MINVYGLKNCDTCRFAIKWLKDKELVYQFHDFRKEVVVISIFQNWANSVGWRELFNKRGTTWRGLPNRVKASINENNSAVLMSEYPAVIKRPVFEVGKKIFIGFNEKKRLEIVSFYYDLFSKK